IIDAGLSGSRQPTRHGLRSPAQRSDPATAPFRLVRHHRPGGGGGDGAARGLRPPWGDRPASNRMGGSSGPGRCRLLRVLARVVLPLIAPSVAATAIVVFVLDWNMLLVPLVLTSGEVKTVPVAMSDFFTF